MVADKIFDLSVSSQLAYQSDIPIKGKTFVKVFIDRVGEGTWEVIDGNDYQLINDSLVFTERPTGALLIMQVATTPSELQQAPTDISILLTIKDEIKTLTSNLGHIVIVSDDIGNVSIVANSIDDVKAVSEKINKVSTVSDNILKVEVVADNVSSVNTVSYNISKVITVSDNILNVNIVAGSISNVSTVANNITKVISVADTVVPNIDEILMADENASIATQKAEEAYISAGVAETYEGLARKWATNPYDVAVDSGYFSAYHWALQSQLWASTVDTSNFVNRVSDQNIDGIKNFLKSPLVPIATLNTQAVPYKQLLDGLATKPDTNGTGASGNWNISISGTAQYANDLAGDITNWTNYRTKAVANMLSWNRYGNGHAIFDASTGTSPTGVGISNIDPKVPWTPTYPTLMGWNGSQTHGVRVDSARVADYVNNGTGLGIGQTWQDLTGSRVVGTTYTNSTGNPIFVLLAFYNDLSVYLGTIPVFGANNEGLANAVSNISLVIPNGSTYKFTSVCGIIKWLELR